MMSEKPILKSDGERMIPQFHHGNIIYGEHIGRYLAIAGIVKGKYVLDIASGSGYGSKIIAKTAKKVWGVDINEPAVMYAKANYSTKNLSYTVGSATEIPLDDSSVDCVISMETIEHIEEQDKFLSEIKRVMSPEGVLVLSTPNDKVYPKGNHFHVKEHNRNSLVRLLSKHFKNVEIHYQVVSIAASIIEEKDLTDPDDISLEHNLIKTYEAEPDKSIYYIAVCGDVKLPPINGNTVLAEEFSHLERQKLSQNIHNLNNQVSDLSGALSRERDTNRKLSAELSDIYNSRRWKMAVKAANIKARFKKPNN